MTFIRTCNHFARCSLGALLAAASGCGGEQTSVNEKPSINIEPTVPRATRTVEDLKNDVKPPVVIKPDAPPAAGAAPKGAR